MFLEIDGESMWLLFKIHAGLVGLEQCHEPNPELERVFRDLVDEELDALFSSKPGETSSPQSDAQAA